MPYYTEKDERPLCSICGLPAREAIVFAEASIPLNEKGAPQGRARLFPGATLKELRYYRCAMRHKWAPPSDNDAETAEVAFPQTYKEEDED